MPEISGTWADNCMGPLVAQGAGGGIVPPIGNAASGQAPSPSSPTCRKTDLPEVFFWSPSTVNMAIPGMAEVRLVSSHEDLTSEEKEKLNTFFVGRQNADLMKSYIYRATGDVAGRARGTYFSMDEYKLPPGKTMDDYKRAFDNPVFLGGIGSSLPGTGIVNLDPDFRSSPYRMLEVEEERFKLEHVLRAGFLPAIRPGDLGGISPIQSRYATLRVMGVDGKCHYATTNFMMEGLNRSVEEDYRPSSGFEENLLQIYGQKFRLYSFKLVMLNTGNFDWLRSWDRAWQNYIRCSVLAKNKWRCYFLYSNRLIGGYPLKYQDAATSDKEPTSDLQMVMFVTDDEALPSMARVENKRGMVYYKWKGTTFVSGVSGNIVDRPIPEYQGDMNLTATSPEETEIESPPAET